MLMDFTVPNFSSEGANVSSVMLSLASHYRSLGFDVTPAWIRRGNCACGDVECAEWPHFTDQMNSNTTLLISSHNTFTTTSQSLVAKLKFIRKDVPILKHGTQFYIFLSSLTNIPEFYPLLGATEQGWIPLPPVVCDTYIDPSPSCPLWVTPLNVASSQLPRGDDFFVESLRSKWLAMATQGDLMLRDFMPLTIPCDDLVETSFTNLLHDRTTEIALRFLAGAVLLGFVSMGWAYDCIRVHSVIDTVDMLAELDIITESLLFVEAMPTPDWFNAIFIEASRQFVDLEDYEDYDELDEIAEIPEQDEVADEAVADSLDEVSNETSDETPDISELVDFEAETPEVETPLDAVTSTDEPADSDDEAFLSPIIPITARSSTMDTEDEDSTDPSFDLMSLIGNVYGDTANESEDVGVTSTDLVVPSESLDALDFDLPIQDENDYENMLNIWSDRFSHVSHEEPDALDDHQLINWEEEMRSAGMNDLNGYTLPQLLLGVPSLDLPDDPLTKLAISDLSLCAITTTNAPVDLLTYLWPDKATFDDSLQSHRIAAQCIAFLVCRFHLAVWSGVLSGTPSIADRVARDNGANVISQLIGDPDVVQHVLERLLLPNTSELSSQRFDLVHKIIHHVPPSVFVPDLSTAALAALCASSGK